MNVLIAKLGATGDVVRTTPLLKRLGGQCIWLTDAKNTTLLDGVQANLKCLAWDQRHLVPTLIKRHHEMPQKFAADR